MYVLGPERYAAIGLFLTIQALAGMLDVGLSTGIARQAAWLTGINADADKFSSLLRSFEIPYAAIASLILITGIFGGRIFLSAAFNIEPKSIGLDSIGIMLLFGSIGIRFPFALYVGYLSGRGYIKWANIIFLITELARILGALALMVWIGPNLSVFFGWQFLIALIATAAAYLSCHKVTPSTHTRASPDWRGMLEIRGVMIGAGQLMFLFVVANNLDKFFLPRFVSTADYGTYVAVGQLAISNFMLVHPIWAAFHPRLLAAIAAKDSTAARHAFLSAAGLMSSVCCAFIVGTMIATPAILRLWVGQHGLRFDAVLIAISMGYGMAALSHLALTIHQAAARYYPTPLILMAAILVIPTSGYLMLDRIDVTAAAVIWSLLYGLNFLAGAITYWLYAPYLLRSWFIYVLCPLSLAFFAGTILSIWTHHLSTPGQLILAILCATLTAILVASFNPAIRDWAKRHLTIELR